MNKESFKARSKSGTVFFILLMGTFIAIAPVSTDIYLPALPGMEADLKASAGSGALTLSAWVLGVASGQLLAGPLMDYFGRRLPLAVGTLVYAFASIGCALSPDMTTLCVFRVIAAFFASFSLVAPQACVRDIAKGSEGARLLSRLALVQGLVPLLAPAMGGMVLEYMSWRVIFWAMAAYGFFSASLVYWIPKNEPKQISEHSIMEKGGGAAFCASFVRAYQNVWKDISFRYYGGIWMLQGIFIFSYLAAAPAIFEKSFGLTPAEYGVLFGATAFVMISVTQLNAALLKKISTVFLLRFAGFAGLLLVCVFTVTAFLSHHILLHGDMAARSVWFWPVAGSLLLSLCAFVMLGPNACACALFYQEKTAGTAASLAGSGVYLFGFLASLLMGVMPQGTAVPLALILFFSISLQLYLSFKAPSLPDDVKKEA